MSKHQTGPVPTERAQFRVPDEEGRLFVVTIEHQTPFVFAGMTIAFQEDEHYKVLVNLSRTARMTPTKMAFLLNETASTLYGEDD